jgi:ADP-heptose:LPS heptosyltransferase
VVHEKTPEIFLSSEEKNWAREWLDQRGFGQKPLVGIHPGAYYESQRWPIEYFVELINLLQADGKADVLLFGGPDDKPLCQMIEIKAATAVGSFPASDIREFSALLAFCQVFVCNNSGPLHMAVALNVPTVSTMGPTVKSCWMPIGDFHKVFRMDQLPCIGCNLGYCKIKTHDCMRLITPVMVFQAIEEKIFNNQSERPI